MFAQRLMLHDSSQNKINIRQKPFANKNPIQRFYVYQGSDENTFFHANLLYDKFSGGEDWRKTSHDIC